MKTLIVLSGIPGCGKSTWTATYKQTHQNVYVVESDEIRYELNGNRQIFTREKEVWDLFLKRLVDYSNQDGDLTVIADSTNLQNLYRKFYCEQTPNYDRHVLIYFDIPFDVAEQNNQKRNGDKLVPDYAMVKLEKELEPLSDEVKEMYDEVITITSYINQPKV